MKNFILILLISLLVCSCYKSAEDARKVKKGITINELKYVMGEPEDIEVNPGYERWTFYYDGGGSRVNGLVVTIKEDKVIDFYSY